MGSSYYGTGSRIAALHLGADCPPDDPLDAAAILHRATVQSCAGCHAAGQLFGRKRSIGCGLTWPGAIERSHVTEAGELSPALKHVFLPKRAEVLARFLGACTSPGDARESLPPKDSHAQPPRRTLGGSITH